MAKASSLYLEYRRFESFCADYDVLYEVLFWKMRYYSLYMQSSLLEMLSRHGRHRRRKLSECQNKEALDGLRKKIDELYELVDSMRSIAERD